MSGARIRIHDDGCGRLHLRWWADDSMLWRDILASFKARFPTHHDRSYAESTKTWSVPRSHYGRLAAWVDRWFDERDQQWTDEEAAGEYGRSYSRSGYSQYRRPQTSSSTIEAAYAHLCLTPDAPAPRLGIAEREDEAANAAPRVAGPRVGSSIARAQIGGQHADARGEGPPPVLPSPGGGTVRRATAHPPLRPLRAS